MLFYYPYQLSKYQIVIGFGASSLDICDESWVYGRGDLFVS